MLDSFRKGYKGSRIVSDETAQEMIFLIRTIQALRVGMKSGANASANPLENMMNMFSTSSHKFRSLEVLRPRLTRDCAGFSESSRRKRTKIRSFLRIIFVCQYVLALSSIQREKSQLVEQINAQMVDCYPSHRDLSHDIKRSNAGDSRDQAMWEVCSEGRVEICRGSDYAG